MEIHNPDFDWLRTECLTIKSPGFHNFIELHGEDFTYKYGDISVPVRGDYGDFLREFGQAILFDGWGNLPVIPFMIYPLKEFRREVLGNRDGRSFVAFADRGSQHVFFEEGKILREESSAVFLLSKHGAKEIYPNFSEWLQASYDWAKAKYSGRQWALVVKGAAPFSDQECKVIEARNQFKWRHTGFAENGDAFFEVENNSTMVLPFLSIGVKDCDEAILIGGVWLDVGGIMPGDKKTVTADCYKDRIPREKLVLFSKPEPIPEKRDRYWEFGTPP